MSGQRHCSCLINQMWPDAASLRAQSTCICKKSRMSCSCDTAGSACLLKDVEHFVFMMLKKPRFQRNPLLALAIPEV